MTWLLFAGIFAVAFGYPATAEFLAVRKQQRRIDALPGRSPRSMQAMQASSSKTVETAAPTLASAQASSDTWKGWQDMTVIGIRDETADCRSFVLASRDERPLPSFLGGQFISVQVQDPISGKKTARCYSLSSSPGESIYRITVKRVPHGFVSNHLHDHIQVGDNLRIQAPTGKFHLDTNATKSPLVLIAAGIGITPMLSMLMHCLEVSPDRKVHLFFQLRDGGNAPFLKLLQKVSKDPATADQVQLHVWFSRPSESDLRFNSQSGRLTAQALLQQTDTTSGDFMICGPEEFMSNIAEGLVDSGVDEARVKYESFGGKPHFVGAIGITDQSADAEIHQVAFTRSHRSVPWKATDGSLLDLAEQEGVEVDSSCRSGDCGMCVQRLLHGNVRYADPPQCEYGEDEVVLCVAEPTSDLQINA